MDCEEVDFGFGVGDGGEGEAASGVDVVAAGADFLARGFDLDEVAGTSVVDDEIVAGVVAVGFGDLEAEVGGAVEKRDSVSSPRVLVGTRSQGWSGGSRGSGKTGGQECPPHTNKGFGLVITVHFPPAMEKAQTRWVAPFSNF